MGILIFKVIIYLLALNRFNGFGAFQRAKPTRIYYVDVS